MSGLKRIIVQISDLQVATLGLSHSARVIPQRMHTFFDCAKGQDIYLTDPKKGLQYGVVRGDGSQVFYLPPEVASGE